MQRYLQNVLEDFNIGLRSHVISDNKKLQKGAGIYDRRKRGVHMEMVK